MNTPFNHLINNRALTTFGSLEQELVLESEKNYLFDLSHLGVIDLTGDKAIDFLQGQLTCDVNSVSDIHIAQGAQCNLKGRILALMDIIQWEGIKLILPEDLIERTINSLNKTAMLSRVTLKENKELRVLGFYLQNKGDLAPDLSFFPENLYAFTYTAQYGCYHLGHGFYIFLCHSEFAEKIINYFEKKDQLRGSLTWHTLRLKKQQISIYPESQGLFLPHRLDLHQTPYLNFNKGCYKGQEIIARMHYKATLKHHLKIYSLKTKEKIYSGQKVLKEKNGAEVGELIDFSLISVDHYIIALSILNDIESFVLAETDTI